MFFIQYDTTTGEISGTVSSLIVPEALPDGRGQVEFSDWVGTEGKAVDLGTLSLVDIPQEPLEP